jgi:hypothetical protein
VRARAGLNCWVSSCLFGGRSERVRGCGEGEKVERRGKKFMKTIGYEKHERECIR